jgi:hypothetical protein
VKRTVISFLVLVLTLTVSSSNAATKVFLLAGQSNMAGEGNVADLTAPYNTPLSEVKFWNNSQWVALRGGFGDGTSGTLFGPEIGFGHRLHELYPKDDIYLVKYGLTSTNLAVDWNPNGAGIRYNIFKSTADAALKNLANAGLSPTIAGMIWMQGENDALNSTYAAAYRNNLVNLISTVRSQFSTPDMPFVDGRVLACYGTQTDSDLVRNAQMTVPAQVGHAAWVNTDDLPLAFTGHYGTQGQIELGIRFANAVASVPEPSTLTLGCVTILTSAAFGIWRRHHRRGSTAV